MTDTNTISARNREAFDQKQIKVQWFKPEQLIAAVNPRSLEELDWEVLMPKILEEKGVITVPLVVWMLEANDPLWETLELRDTMTGERIPVPPVEVRESLRIIIQGHRRERCAGEINANPGKYTKEVCDNIAKVPAIEYRGITEQRARDLALDDEAKKTLKSWETVKLLLGKFSRDERYQDIALEMPQLLYKALLKNGADKYDEVARIHDGTERNARIVKDLRNKLDTWIRSGYLAGPAVAEQLTLYFRYKVNKRPDVGDRDRLLMDLKYEHIRDRIRKVYNTEKDKDYIPVTRIELVPTKPEDQPNQSVYHVGQDGFFVIEGGTEVMRDSLLKLMREFKNPEEKEKGPVLPTKNEREDVKIGSRSGPGKAYSLFFSGEATEVNGKSRSEWDTWALGYQEREERIGQFKDGLHPAVKAIAEAVVSERNGDKLEAVFMSVSEAIKATEKSSQQPARKSKTAKR